MALLRRFLLVLPLLRMAVRSLSLYKLRSFLTVLGLVFGVASVIVMLAIAEGASYEAYQQIESLGVRNLIVQSVKPIEETRKQSEETQRVLAYGLSWEDLNRIRLTIPSVTGATPLREFRQEIRFLDRGLEGRVVGATPEYLQLTSLQLAQGRFLEDTDLGRLRNVCVIGSELAERLFPYQNAMGKSIRVGPKHYYQVIGVTKYKAPTGGAGSSLSGQEFNRDVYIPITTDRARFGEIIFFGKAGSQSFERVELSQITVQIDGLEHVKPTARVLEGMLAEFHPKGDYAVTIPLELIEQAEQTQRIFSLLLGSTAGISLLVGGIGIMNIMLATVTERTREIGIRRALGARRRDIVWQFLIETAFLSLTGGLLGLVLGLALPQAVSWIFGRTTIVSFWSPALSLCVALVVGISFGVYPARRAAQLDPVEALQHE